ncbi:MAG: preprotein translocase subunit SecE [Gammaproteobacteria bacterium]
MVDSIKFILVALIMSGAIGGFYYYGDESLLLRVVGVLVATLIGGAIALQTAAGQRAWEYLGEARTEVRKVVWPTRQETLQTTLIVLLMVVIVAVMLWFFDWVLSWAVSWLTGQGG